MLLVREFVLVGVVLLGSIACVLCSSLITKILLPFHNSGFMLYAGLFYARVMRIPLCKSNVHSSPATYCLLRLHPLSIIIILLTTHTHTHFPTLQYYPTTPIYPSTAATTSASSQESKNSHGVSSDSPTHAPI